MWTLLHDGCAYVPAMLTKFLVCSECCCISNNPYDNDDLPCEDENVVKAIETESPHFPCTHGDCKLLGDKFTNLHVQIDFSTFGIGA